MTHGRRVSETAMILAEDGKHDEHEPCGGSAGESHWLITILVGGLEHFFMGKSTISMALGLYPLVNERLTMENHHAING